MGDHSEDGDILWKLVALLWVSGILHMSFGTESQFAWHFAAVFPVAAAGPSTLTTTTASVYWSTHYVLPSQSYGAWLLVGRTQGCRLPPSPPVMHGLLRCM